jgi:hypothetical protein
MVKKDQHKKQRFAVFQGSSKDEKKNAECFRYDTSANAFNAKSRKLMIFEPIKNKYILIVLNVFGQWGSNFGGLNGRYGNFIRCG